MSGAARAHALLMANRPADALAELSRLPADEATGGYAIRLRCHALAQLGNYLECAIACRAALTAGGPDPDLLCLLGRSEQQLGNHAVAERALLDGLALAPQDVDLLCAYAGLCVATAQPDKAQRLIDLAANLKPEAPIVYAGRVQAAMARGDDRLAQAIARQFVAAHPDNPGAHALLGSASAARGDMGAGYAGMRQAAASAPGEPGLADAAMELRIARHPLMIPVRPFLRFGPFRTWIAAVLIIVGLRAVGAAPLATLFAVCWFVLCVYSWVVPPLVRKWMRRNWR